MASGNPNSQFFDHGYRMFTGGRLANAIGYQQLAYNNNLVALAGGGATGATQLTNAYNHILTCATTADSCKLPPAIPGNICYLMNAGAQSTTVYAYEGSATTINATSGATGVAQAAGVGALYFCPLANLWSRIQSS